MSEPGLDPQRRKSLLERALSLIAEVRPGEGTVVLLLALNLFLILSAYYLLKTVREALILTEVTAAVKTYASAGQALLLLGLVPAFGALASRVNRVALITWVTLFFAGNVLVFFFLARTGLHVGVVFFVWVGIFNVMAISQLWAFANDLFTAEQGKRLLAVVGVGSSLGAWVGSLYAGRIGKAVGPYTLMLVAAGMLVACVVVTHIVNAFQHSRQTTEQAAESERPLGKQGGFELIFKDRYLMLIAVLIVVLNVVNTTGEYLLSTMAQAQAGQLYGLEEASRLERQKFMSGFYGSFFGWVNGLGFVLQMLAVSRLIKLLGVGGALFIHPLLALGGYVSMIFAPSLGLVRNLKVLDNSTDYSLNNTLKQALWLPTSREAKYKAKQAVDSFFMRAGDVLAAGAVFVGQALGFAVPVFAGINVGLAVVWLLIVGRLAPENRRRMKAAHAE